MLKRMVMAAAGLAALGAPTAEAEIVTQLRGEDGAAALLVRHEPGPGPSVIYIHGASFPSALSVGYRFPGGSWTDRLRAQGFDVWAFDFAGYGGSDRPAAFANAAQAASPIGRAPDAGAQLARVVEHVRQVTGKQRVSLLAHSWGTVVAGWYAQHYAQRVDRMVLFGPVAQRNTPDLPPPDSVGAWQLVSVADQLNRFVKPVPAGHPPVLIEPALELWGPAWLASDPDAAARLPVAAVKVPSGPGADILDAWSGHLPYNPAKVLAPTLIVRGEWEVVTTDADAAWLMQHLGATEKRDIKIAKGTHLMHLEHSREELFAATAAFLAGGK